MLWCKLWCSVLQGSWSACVRHRWGSTITTTQAAPPESQYVLKQPNFSHATKNRRPRCPLTVAKIYLFVWHNFYWSVQIQKPVHFQGTGDIPRNSIMMPCHFHISCRIARIQSNSNFVGCPSCGAFLQSWRACRHEKKGRFPVPPCVGPEGRGRVVMLL